MYLHVVTLAENDDSCFLRLARKIILPDIHLEYRTILQKTMFYSYEKKRISFLRITGPQNYRPLSGTSGESGNLPEST